MDERSDEMIAKKCREESPRSESNETEVRVYSRDSFDRFGDDLCQYLLSYLSLEDRFRCECVAKQWQRVVYTTQMDLIYDKKCNYKLNYNSFEWMLKKCPNITSIQLVEPICQSNKPIFDLVIKYCHRLHTFIDHNFKNIDFNTHYFTVDTVDQFTKFAKQLKTFKLNELFVLKISDLNEANIKLCHNITQFGGISDDRNTIIFFPLLCKPKMILFPKLRKVSLRYSNDIETGFKLFVDIYGNQLKAFDVIIDFRNDDNSVKVLINGVSQMRALIDLHIISDNKFVIDFKQICQQLTQLKRLSLEYYLFTKSEDWTQMIQTIVKDFKRLKRLSLSSWVAINALKCKRLTHLSINSLCGSSHKFLNSISTNLPKLHYLDIKHNRITDEVLNGLLLVPKLRYIGLKGIEMYSQSVLKKLMVVSNKAVIDIHI